MTSSADLDVMDMQAQARAMNREAAAAQLPPLPGSHGRGLSLHRWVLSLHRWVLSLHRWVLSLVTQVGGSLHRWCSLHRWVARYTGGWLSLHRWGLEAM